jgi:phosphohistidine phosphatase
VRISGFEMKLVLVRHADAGDAEEFAKSGKPDDLRPLSAKGREQMSSGVRGLKLLVPSADLIVSSPYVRAVQTADIVAKEYERTPREQTNTIEPERAPAEFEEWLKEQRGDYDVVIAVGHEPHLSTLATWLMVGSDDSRIDMKKGGAALLLFDKRPKKSAGTLRWLMGPKELGALR